MGWFIFILIVVVIIISVISMKKNKENEEIEKLKTMAGYGVALKIKEKLVMEGYDVGDLSTFMGSYGARGSFRVYKNSMKIGHIDIAFYNNDFKRDVEDLKMPNYEGKKRYYHFVFDNYINNINLIVYSASFIEDFSQVSQFLQISKEVISNCGYQFNIQTHL